MAPDARSEREEMATNGHVNASLEEVFKRLDTYAIDISAIWKKLDAAARKQEESDSVRRGQLDSISARIFEVEKNTSQVEARQEDALEKASATFQKQSSNLMQVIGQVNTNFEQLSGEIDRQGVKLTTMESALEQLQSGVSVMSRERRSFGQDVLALEQSLRQQQLEMAEFRALAESVEGTQSQFGELKAAVLPIMNSVARQNKNEELLKALTDELEEVREWIGRSEAQQQDMMSDFRELQKEVAALSIKSAAGKVAQAMEPELKRRVDSCAADDLDLGIQRPHHWPDVGRSRNHSLGNVMNLPSVPNGHRGSEPLPSRFEAPPGVPETRLGLKPSSSSLAQAGEERGPPQDPAARSVWWPGSGLPDWVQEEWQEKVQRVAMDELRGQPGIPEAAASMMQQGVYGL